VVVPLPVAVTRPEELTVATAVFAEVHVRAGEPIVLPFWSVIVAVSWTVWPIPLRDTVDALRAAVVGIFGSVPPPPHPAAPNPSMRSRVPEAVL
jgi:hypothetical protein